MLQITVPASQDWDEEHEIFVTRKEQTLRLEHSLLSLSKWESKWCKPFLSTTNLTDEETLDYIRCMTLTQNVPPDVYTRLNSKHIQEISDYINAPMTATTFSERQERGRINREIVTAEIIYYWMIALQIPSDYEKWHLNRLLTLIRVCNIKNTPPKKMSKGEIMRRNAAINAARRKKYNSNG